MLHFVKQENLVLVKKAIREAYKHSKGAVPGKGESDSFVDIDEFHILTRNIKRVFEFQVAFRAADSGENARIDAKVTLLAFR